MKELPGWLSAYLVAGIFSAAMCSESSALNSLASALSLDFVAPLIGKKAVEGRRGLVLGKVLTLFWTVVLAGLAVGFSLIPQGRPGRAGRARPRERDGGRPPRRASSSRSRSRKARQADAIVGIGDVGRSSCSSSGSARAATCRSRSGSGSRGRGTRMLGVGITVGTGWLLSRRHAADDPATIR